jgi:uncharacterized membrane protein
MTTQQILLTFAGIGLLTTLYLIWHKVRGTDVACIGFPKEWCRKVQYSRQSVTFGIPNSVAGFLMYAAVFLLVLFMPQLPLGITALGAIQFLVLFGFAFSLYFMYVQVFVLRALCTWCVISFIDFTVMSWALFIR